MELYRTKDEFPILFEEVLIYIESKGISGQANQFLILLLRKSAELLVKRRSTVKHLDSPKLDADQTQREWEYTHLVVLSMSKILHLLEKRAQDAICSLTSD